MVFSLVFMSEVFLFHIKKIDLKEERGTEAFFMIGYSLLTFLDKIRKCLQRNYVVVKIIRQVKIPEVKCLKFK